MTEEALQSLESALKHYEQAIHSLGQTSHSAQEVLAVLVARDAVQSILTDITQIPASSIIVLTKLDDRLREQTEPIIQTPEFANWRVLLNPPETAWWWYLKLDAPISRWDRFDGILNLATIGFMTASVALILNTSSRFFIGGADAWGALAIVGQSVLALITGGSLTQKGRELLESTFTGLKIPKQYWQEVNGGLSLALLLVILGFRAALPQIATGFNQHGLKDYKTGKLDSALSNYQQAIALRPNYAEAHYNLGTLYEHLQKTDQAIAEYQLVAQNDLVEESKPDSADRETVLRAYNNLGRLYILKGDNQVAWMPLERGLSLIDSDAAKNNSNIQYEHYKLLKNLAWVRLQQKSYVDAANLIQEAIDLQSQIEPLFKDSGGKAAPFCLQAQVLEAQKQAAESAWTSCIRYAQRSNSDEAQWTGMAYEHLAKQKKQP